MTEQRPVFTMRPSRSALRELQEEARRYDVAPRTLAQAILEEGLRMRRHPGIVFVDRPGGRAAVLAGHPRMSVWQVVEVHRSARSLAATARQLTLGVDAVRRALAYAAEYPAEVDAAIAANEAAFERVQRLYPAALPQPERRPRRAAASR